VAIGLVLWLVIGPAIALTGITTRYEGWWPFGRLVIFVIAIVLLVLAVVLEILDRHKV